jgi:membrane-bound serine protease (ClpP class)
LLLTAAIILMLFVLPSPWGAVVVVGAAITEVAEIAFWLRFLRRYRISTGVEAYPGETAVVVRSLRPEGQVRLQGALWRARAEEPIEAGATVRVRAVDGLTLEVEPASEE